MKLPRAAKVAILLFGDIAILYASLVLTLLIRYHGSWREAFLEQHAFPFTIAFGMWIVVFYIAGLYDPPRLRNNLEFLKTLGVAVTVNAFLTIALFYFVPAFGITPKTNLFIFLAVFLGAGSYWRIVFNRQSSFREGLIRAVLIGESPRTEEVYREVTNVPQHGYDIRLRIDEAHPDLGRLRTLRQLVARRAVDLVVVPARLKHDAETRRSLYELLASGVEIRDLPAFYETVFRKIPIAEIDESWFADHNPGRRSFADRLKRAGEFASALLLGAALLPLELLIALGIALSSSGPAIYRQTRIGKGGRPFTLYKFRTMRADAEKDGPRWKASGGSDPRLTPFGKFLVRTHLDELPQLWNIIRGELSFVGPRPERPEFVKVIERKVPYYHIRHLVNPGITGWAQISYRYGSSVEDAYRKLEYDLYYLKNRSFIMDIAVMLKTVKSFFVNQA